MVAAGASGVASETSTRPIYDYADTLPDSGKPILEEAARVSVYTVDADKMVQRLSGSWDVIVVDFPDPNSVELAKLYSREFYLKLRRILSNGGIMAVQSTSPYHSKEAFLCVRRTLASAGYETVPYHDNVPSFGDWGLDSCMAFSEGGQRRSERDRAARSFWDPRRPTAVLDARGFSQCPNVRQRNAGLAIHRSEPSHASGSASFLSQRKLATLGLLERVRRGKWLTPGGEFGLRVERRREISGGFRRGKPVVPACGRERQRLREG